MKKKRTNPYKEANEAFLAEKAKEEGIVALTRMHEGDKWEVYIPAKWGIRHHEDGRYTGAQHAHLHSPADQDRTLDITFMETYQIIELAEWQQVGEGGNGKTYVNPSAPGEILKVNNARLSTLKAVQHEYDVSKAVEGLGISVPQVFHIVRVGDAYATISQLIKDKKSLSRICHDEPEHTEEMARLLCQKGKELFATPCNTVFFPSRKEQVLWAIDHATFVSKKNRKLIRAFAETIPEKTTCVHGDFQPGNIIQSGDYYYWIDLDRFAYGDPMFDIGHLFQICKVYAPMKRVQEIFHMTQEQFGRFWDAFAKEYTGKEDHSEFDNLAGKFACLDVIVRTYFVKPTFLEKLFFGTYVRKLVKEYYL